MLLVSKACPKSVKPGGIITQQTPCTLNSKAFVQAAHARVSRFVCREPIWPSSVYLTSLDCHCLFIDKIVRNVRLQPDLTSKAWSIHQPHRKIMREQAQHLNIYSTPAKIGLKKHIDFLRNSKHVSTSFRMTSKSADVIRYKHHETKNNASHAAKSQVKFSLTSFFRPEQES